MMQSAAPLPRSGSLVTGWRRTRLLPSLAGAFLAVLLASLAFLLHLNLSSAGSLELLLVVVIALRWGFREATAASLAATTGLNVLFIPPLFKLTVADPANWVSLATFETTALVVSRLSTRMRMHAVEAETQRGRATKLYELSRAILLIDGRSQVQEQLCALIREIIEVKDVRLSLLPRPSRAATLSQETGRNELNDSMDYVGQVATRTLRIGTTGIGTLILSGWENDRSLADAVASLAAVAIERARAVQEESRAESERDTERLRTAVLDGLAHGFKTPLTAIQTASSGLLAIGDANPTQMELLSIVDEQATLLNTLTTKLLKTASLESRQVRLHKTEESLNDIIQHVIEQCEPPARLRIDFTAQDDIEPSTLDAELVTLAISQLMDNALKYSDIGSAVMVCLAQDGEASTVTVESTGSPIPVDEQEKIFERFYRGSNAAGGPTGTGLGLSIVSKAAAAHDGRASLQTNGRQSRFSFTVPHRG